MNAEKWHSQIRIAINDESQDSIAKNLRCDELLHYTFIIHSAGSVATRLGCCGDAFPIERVLVATYLLSVEALPHCR